MVQQNTKFLFDLNLISVARRVPLQKTYIHTHTHISWHWNKALLDSVNNRLQSNLFLQMCCRFLLHLVLLQCLLMATDPFTLFDLRVRHEPASLVHRVCAAYKFSFFCIPSSLPPAPFQPNRTQPNFPGFTYIVAKQLETHMRYWHTFDIIRAACCCSIATAKEIEVADMYHHVWPCLQYPYRSFLAFRAVMCTP